MARRKPVLKNIRVDKVAAGGKCVARHQGRVIFIDGDTAPGDVVDVKVQRKRSSYWEGIPINYHECSPERVEPFCPVFGECGGCRWQHLPLEAQRRAKREQVRDQFQRIGGLSVPEVEEVRASPQSRYYRDKMEYTFTDRRWLTAAETNQAGDLDRRGLGLFRRGRYDRVVDLDHCYLQNGGANTLRNTVRDICRRRGIPFYNQETHEGIMRNLVVRTNRRGEMMVLVVTAPGGESYREEVSRELGESCPGLVSLYWAENDKKNPSYDDLVCRRQAGEAYLTVELLGMSFALSPQTFFQVNLEQAEKMFELVLERAELTPHDTVFDFYCGVGSLSLPAAARAGRVIGMELSRPAVALAARNAEANGLTNVSFVAGDMARVVSGDEWAGFPAGDVVIVDPPRAGMHPDVVAALLRMAPRTIVYVSCNPATQARDTALMSAAYTVESLIPFDMFPHTYHVENVAVLRRVKEAK